MDREAVLSGTLHIAVAFDWGEEIDLVRAAELVPSERQSMPRRRRTPPSITYYSPPLLMRLALFPLNLPELGSIMADSDATIFDFGAVSIAFRIPFRLQAEQLSSLADSFSEPKFLVEGARMALGPLFEQLRPAVKNAAWSDLTEEYFVFQFDPRPQGIPVSPTELLDQSSSWLAGLLRLDNSPLSAEEVSEAVKRRISYTPNDLAIVEWAAAVLVDETCEDTLQTIEFANVQLLEYRHVDRRVDASLEQAYGLIHPLAESRLPFWGFQTRPLRVLGDLRVDALALFGRASSALKLVGDQYVARIYRMLCDRFRLEEWSQGIHNTLDEAQTVYEILREESAAARIELLELIVIVLIVIEIVLSVFFR